MAQAVLIGLDGQVEWIEVDEHALTVIRPDPSTSDLARRMLAGDSVRDEMLALQTYVYMGKVRHQGRIYRSYVDTALMRAPAARAATMTDGMYDVYRRHGGQKKKHPLDEVQGL